MLFRIHILLIASILCLNALSADGSISISVCEKSLLIPKEYRDDSKYIKRQIKKSFFPGSKQSQAMLDSIKKSDPSLQTMQDVATALAELASTQVIEVQLTESPLKTALDWMYIDLKENTLQDIALTFIVERALRNESSKTEFNYLKQMPAFANWQAVISYLHTKFSKNEIAAFCGVHVKELILEKPDDQPRYYIQRRLKELVDRSRAMTLDPHDVHSQSKRKTLDAEEVLKRINILNPKLRNWQELYFSFRLKFGKSVLKNILHTQQEDFETWTKGYVLSEYSTAEKNGRISFTKNGPAPSAALKTLLVELFYTSKSKATSLATKERLKNDPYALRVFEESEFLKHARPTQLRAAALSKRLQTRYPGLLENYQWKSLLAFIQCRFKPVEIIDLTGIKRQTILNMRNRKSPPKEENLKKIYLLFIKAIDLPEFFPAELNAGIRYYNFRAYEDRLVFNPLDMLNRLRVLTNNLFRDWASYINYLVQYRKYTIHELASYLAMDVNYLKRAANNSAEHLAVPAKRALIEAHFRRADLMRVQAQLNRQGLKSEGEIFKKIFEAIGDNAVALFARLLLQDLENSRTIEKKDLAFWKAKTQKSLEKDLRIWQRATTYKPHSEFLYQSLAQYHRELVIEKNEDLRDRIERNRIAYLQEKEEYERISDNNWLQVLNCDEGFRSWQDVLSTLLTLNNENFVARRLQAMKWDIQKWVEQAEPWQPSLNRQVTMLNLLQKKFKAEPPEKEAITLLGVPVQMDQRMANGEYPKLLRLTRKADSNMTNLYQALQWLQEHSNPQYLYDTLGITPHNISGWRLQNSISLDHPKAAKIAALYRHWQGVDKKGELSKQFEGRKFLAGSTGIVYSNWIARLRAKNGHNSTQAKQFILESVDFDLHLDQSNDLSRRKNARAASPDVVSAVESAYNTEFPLSYLLPKEVRKHMHDKKLIGRWLRKNRERLELTIYELLKRINEDEETSRFFKLRSNVHVQIERGDLYPSFETLIILTDFFLAQSSYLTIKEMLAREAQGVKDLEAIKKTDRELKATAELTASFLEEAKAKVLLAIDRKLDKNQRNSFNHRLSSQLISQITQLHNSCKATPSFLQDFSQTCLETSKFIKLLTNSTSSGYHTYKEHFSHIVRQLLGLQNALKKLEKDLAEILES